MLKNDETIKEWENDFNFEKKNSDDLEYYDNSWNNKSNVNFEEKKGNIE